MEQNIVNKVHLKKDQKSQNINMIEHTETNTNMSPAQINANTTRNNIVNINRNKIPISDTEKELFSFLFSIYDKSKSYKIMDKITVEQNKKTSFTKDKYCPICMTTGKSENMAITRCGHSFCIKCIVQNMNYKRGCPLCRTQITLDDITTFQQKNTKYVFLISLIKKYINNKIIIYVPNIFTVEYTCKILSKNKISSTACIGTNNNKRKLIKNFNNSIKHVIILQSSDYKLAKNIIGVTKIVICDYNYNFIINKDAIGYDFIKHKKPISLEIFEI